jgi:D-alanine transaminase
MKVWLNGRILDESQAQVSVLDRGFLFGDGVYEVVRYFARPGAPPWGASEAMHAARLARSLRLSRIEGFDAGGLPHVAKELLAANGLSDASLYLQVTRGAGATRAHVPGGPLVPTVFASVTPCEPIGQVREPSAIRAITLEDLRWRLCSIKTVSLMGNILALLEADGHGAQEAILHRGGLVGEGAYSNVLCVREGTLVTPPIDDDPPILHGVTRVDVLDAARAAGVPVEVRPLPLAELREADEIMISASRRLVSGVTHLDGEPVGRGEVGPVTRRVFTAFRNAIAAGCAPAAVSA